MVFLLIIGVSLS